MLTSTGRRSGSWLSPRRRPPGPLQGRCKLDPTREAPLPIDDSAADAITDSDEAYNLMQRRGIDNVIVMGVHVNMCALGRPFRDEGLTAALRGLSVRRVLG